MKLFLSILFLTFNSCQPAFAITKIPNSMLEGPTTLGTVSGTLGITNGGTGQVLKTPAFNALSPLTTKGDLLVIIASGDNTRKAIGTDGQVLTADSSDATGVKWATPAVSAAPTIQIFTSGSGTYTTPANVKYIKVKMVGGGGGSAGSGNAGTAGAGGNGSASTFGSSLLTAGGGEGGQIAAGGYFGGGGGTAVINAPAIVVLNIEGGSGSSASGASSAGVCGGSGGNSFYGGGGGGRPAGASKAGATNTGGGGGGAGSNSTALAGAGGGAGAYIEAIINTPSATYSYAVGAGGTAGGAGTSGVAGGAGGTGVIIVEEYY